MSVPPDAEKAGEVDVIPDVVVKPAELDDSKVICTDPFAFGLLALTFV